VRGERWKEINHAKIVMPATRIGGYDEKGDRGENCIREGGRSYLFCKELKVGTS
jgi:hypothetical protein